MSGEKKPRYKKKKSNQPSAQPAPAPQPVENLYTFTLPVISPADLEEDDIIVQPRKEVSFEDKSPRYKTSPRQEPFPPPEPSQIKPSIEPKSRMTKIPKMQDSGAPYTKMAPGPYSVQQTLTTINQNARSYLEGARTVQRTTIDQNEMAVNELVKSVMDIAADLVTEMRNNPYYKFASEVGTLIHNKSTKYIQSSAMRMMDLLKLDTLQAQKDIEKSISSLASSLKQMTAFIKLQEQIPTTQTSASNMRLNFLIDQESMLMKHFTSIQESIMFINQLLKKGSIASTKSFFLSEELIVMAERSFNNIKNWWQNTRPSASVDQNIVDLDINRLIMYCPSSRLVLAEYIYYDYQQSQFIKGYRPTTKYRSQELVEKLIDTQGNLILRLREELNALPATGYAVPTVVPTSYAPTAVSLPVSASYLPQPSSILSVAMNSSGSLTAPPSAVYPYAYAAPASSSSQSFVDLLNDSSR